MLNIQRIILHNHRMARVISCDASLHDRVLIICWDVTVLFLNSDVYYLVLTRYGRLGKIWGDPEQSTVSEDLLQSP